MRFYAKLIDLILQGIILGGCSALLMVVFSTLGLVRIGTGLTMLVSFLLYWFYDVFFEQSQASATPGKRLMKLQVKTLAGAPPPFFHSLTRAFLLPIDALPVGLIGLSSIMATPYSQRLGDLCAGTVVVHRERPEQGETLKFSVPAVVPPVPLSRPEKQAFLSFAQSYQRLSQERQREVVAHLALSEALQVGPSFEEQLTYVLGIAQWLNQSGRVS